MALTINLRHLERHDLHLRGELLIEDLDLAGIDELIQLPTPLQYDLRIERPGNDILVRGSLFVALDCQCVRCLKPIKNSIRLDPWMCDIPLVGEDQVHVDNDCVDLTPFVREDILLAFPQHPLCDKECVGLPQASQFGQPIKPSESGPGSSAWAELNKLKF